MRILNKSLIIAMVLVFNTCNLLAQELSSDELFLQARSFAFDKKDYKKAIELSKKALDISPTYEDIRLFLGRIYTWSDALKKAENEFLFVLKQSPDNSEATIAYANLKYWNNDSKTALEIINKGLVYNTTSSNLLLYKAKVLNDLKRWTEAAQVINFILTTGEKESEARVLLNKIKDKLAKNEIGISYEYVYFDERFSDPWHLVTLDYSRPTLIGSVIAKINYANRFLTNGYQFELDAYPSFTDNLRGYVSVGFSDSGIFPDFKSSFSLYIDLPKSFEFDLGYRYLNFGTPTWIYTASLGKYYSNYWFNLRTYLTPSNEELSRSISLTTRYYFGGANDYFSFRIGTGLSPDDPQNGILIGSSNLNLQTHNVNLAYKKTYKTFNVVTFTCGLENQEYRQGVKGNQIDFGIAYSRRF